MGKMRLDALLLERGMAISLAQARAWIMDGKVLVGEQPLTKPGTPVAADAAVRLLGRATPWVSRGGSKLAHGLDTLALSVEGACCLDVGSATGGFVDVLLQRGAAKVYAMDVGYGQLAWSLAQDPRVVVLDRTNIRFAERTLIPDAIDFLTMDVSFMGLSQALPPALHFLSAGGCGVVLLKPQFELPRGRMMPGGVVRDPALHQEAAALCEQLLATLGLELLGSTPSPIAGPKGNREFLYGFRKGEREFPS
ncbi:MAG: TlyA family RNA methyltransferase [Magnetococcus sp. XQGC-1]